jgi:hypothetical protein
LRYYAIFDDHLTSNLPEKPGKSRTFSETTTPIKPNNHKPFRRFPIFFARRRFVPDSLRM